MALTVQQKRDLLEKYGDTYLAAKGNTTFWKQLYQTLLTDAQINTTFSDAQPLVLAVLNTQSTQRGTKISDTQSEKDTIDTDITSITGG